MFNKGQKVVYVDDSGYPPQVAGLFREMPVLGNTYTIRDCFPIVSGVNGGKMAIHLKEIINPMLPHPSGMGNVEPSFSANRFVPLEEYDDSIEELISVSIEETI
jgi:hypothetical protein